MTGAHHLHLPREHFAHNLRALREARGLSIEALASAAPALGASPAARINRADVVVERGAAAPRGLARLLAPHGRALRAAGVPTKFLVLRALPRRPIAYTAALRAQHRRRTGEDANVVIAWPRAGFVAFDARVPDPEEEAASPTGTVACSATGPRSPAPA